MLTQLETFGPNADTAYDIPLDSTIETDPIYIKNIDGLGPVAASITTSDLALIDGVSFQNASVGLRNIVLTYGFNTNLGAGEQTIDGLRGVLYRSFMPKTKVRLVFQLDNDDATRVQIEGYVETCDPTIFTKDPEVQVSIVCPRPNFEFVNETVVTGVTDWWAYDLSTEIYYPGSVETGAILTLAHDPFDILDAPEPLRLINTHNFADEIFYMDALVLDDTETLTINSKPREKNAYYTMSSLKRSALGSVSTTSKWLTLKPGTNYLGVHWLAGKAWELRYRPQFGGL